MALAILHLTNGSLRPIDPVKGVAYWNALHGHSEPTAEQADKLMHLKDVYIPPSYQEQAIGYTEAHRELKARMKAGKQPRAELTNPGVQQGMNEALPRNDR